MLGAVLVTLLQVALSTVTDAWQLYSGLLFVAMVVWAPGGLSGIILAHAPILRAGRGLALVGDYLKVLPGLVLALVGIAALAELAFRLQAVRGGAVSGRLFGLAVDDAVPWLLSVAVFGVGVWLLRRFFPGARAAWQAAA